VGDEQSTRCRKLHEKLLVRGIVQTPDRVGDDLDAAACFQQSHRGVLDADFGDDAVDYAAFRAQAVEQRWKIRICEAIDRLFFEKDLPRVAKFDWGGSVGYGNALF